MKRLVTMIVLGIAAISLAGCGNINNQDIGTLAGGALGGLVGNQFGGGNGRVIATIGGTLVGAFIGNRIGQTMDQVDQMRVQQALNEQGPTDWYNKNTNQRYKVVTGRVNGESCRPYSVYAYMGGSKKRINGCACLRNHHWVSMSANHCNM